MEEELKDYLRKRSVPDEILDRMEAEKVGLSNGSFGIMSPFKPPHGVVGWCDGAGLTSSAGASLQFGLQ